MPKVPEEVISEQYQLKATFFANSLERLHYVGLFEYAAKNLAKMTDTLDWSDSEVYGVKPEMLKEIEQAGLSTALYLCHPNVLVLNARYLKYFRCISAISQKGLKSISGVSSVDKLEEDKRPCSAEQAVKLSKAINENLTAIYSVALPTSEKLKGLMYATAGTTLDGSWRNKIGSEGERVIRTLFLKVLLSHGELKGIKMKGGAIQDGALVTDQWLDENTPDISSAMVKNGSVVVFGSEPDITLVGPNSKVVAGVEIKAGIDPAGALERLGAMMKSFDNIRLASSEAETILVASCITPEVEQRLDPMIAL